MDFKKAAEILVNHLGEDLIHFEGISEPNLDGEYEFKILKKDSIRQRVHISENKIYFRIPDNYLE
jgi:hypothetical protein